MAKETGLGARFFVGGYDLSGDTGALSALRCSRAVQDVTGLDKEGTERLGLLADSEISWANFFNFSPALGSSHTKLSLLPTDDQVIAYLHRPTIGAPAAYMQAKQINYDWARAQDGSLLGSVQGLSTGGRALEWGISLTAGRRADSAGTNGAGYDTGVVSTAFGWSAALEVFSLTGTNLIATIQDSPDGSTWTNLTGGAFTSVLTAGVPTALYLTGAITATVRRHLRVVSSGTFSAANFAVQFTRFEAAQLAL